MLQESDGLQTQENMPSDLWFDGISSPFPQVGQQNMNPAFDPFSFLPDPSANDGTQELYLPNAYSPLGSLLPPDIISMGGVNPPPSAPLTGTIVPHVTPPLVSIPTQECHLHPPNTSIQLPGNLSLGLLDEKGNEAVTDERRGGQSQRDSGKKGGCATKRKADDALVGTKDSGAPKPKKHAKHMGETAGQGATDATCTMGTTEADMLEKVAKIAEEAAIEVAKSAKEAREAVGPERARRSGHVSTLPDHLKEAGYVPPKRVSRGKKSA